LRKQEVLWSTEILEAAKKLYAAHFGATDNPQAMAAIIAALARNYSSAVAANVL